MFKRSKQDPNREVGVNLLDWSADSCQFSNLTKPCLNTHELLYATEEPALEQLLHAGV